MSKHLTLFAKLTAKPQHADALGESLFAMLEPTRAEPGCIGYALHRDNNDPNIWLLYETWRSRADLEAHFEQPYTRALMGRFPELLATDMELNYATLTSPKSKAEQ